MCFQLNYEEKTISLCCYTPHCDGCYAAILKTIERATIVHGKCNKRRYECPWCKEVNVSCYDCMRDILKDDRTLRYEKKIEPPTKTSEMPRLGKR